MLNQRYLEDTAGTIRFSPIEGAPITSATISLFSPDKSTLEDEASITLSTANTTLSSAASAGSTTIALTSATGFVSGGHYWVGTAGTETPELVQIRSLSGSTATLSEKIRYAHASGQHVKAAEMTYTLTTAHTATLDTNYRARWTYIVNAVTLQATQTWDVVASIFKLTLTPADLAVRIPQSLRRSTRGIHSLSQVIQEAENDIIDEMNLRGYRADLVRNPAQFRTVGIIGCEVILLNRARLVDSASYSQTWKDSKSEWAARISEVLTSVDWYDRDEDLGVDTGSAEDGELTEEGTSAIYYLPLG